MSKKLDLAGQKFNILLAVSESDKKDKSGGVYWNCLCGCGKAVVVSSKHLRSGHTKSCGCITLKYGDLTGYKFGQLLVLRLECFKNGKRYWLCKCDCCKEIVVQTKDLTCNNTKSCGCIRAKNLTNKRLGLLIGQKLSNKTDKHGNKYWECLCDCGNTVTVVYSELISGRKNNCGCIKHPKGNKHKSWSGCKDISGSFWCRIKASAKLRNIPFDITIEQAWEILQKQEYKSYLSGKLLYLPKASNDYHTGNCTASLDRIDSGKGYTIDNVSWVHKDENLIKGGHSVEELLYWCNFVTNKDILDYKLSIPKIKRVGRWNGCELISGVYFSSVRCNARRRGIDVEINIKQIWDLFIKQNGRCAITNLPIFFKDGFNTEQTASLDRY